MRRSQVLFYAGLLLTGAGFVLLFGREPAFTPTNASTNDTGWVNADVGVNYLGWGTLALGFLTLASSHYFKLREARRADRAEAREVHDRLRSPDDVR